MTRALLTLLSSITALVATRWLLVAAIPRAPLRRANYRGVRVATGLGVVAVAGTIAGVAAAAAISGLRPGSAEIRTAVSAAVPLLAAAAGFGLLGLWDDLYGAAGALERGFRGHVGALREGRLTGGGLKMLAGAALAVAVSAPHATAFGWLVVDGATIALLANLFNGLDLRPGRAAKLLVVAASPMTVVAAPVGVPMGALLGASVAFLPEDLRERAMLGDAGANALGAMTGAAIVYTDAASWFRLVILAFLVALAFVADGPGFGRLIARTPGLRTFDRAGRVEEEQEQTAQPAE